MLCIPACTKPIWWVCCQKALFMFHLIIEAGAIWSTFVNSLKDKQCRLIFTAAFSHIYQGFQYQWRALYIILIGQSWHSNVFCIIDSCLKQLIFYTTNSISLGTLWFLFSHIINSNPYLILFIYTYRISTMRKLNWYYNNVHSSLEWLIVVGKNYGIQIFLHN